MKHGDLVKVSFGPDEKPITGIFIEDDTYATALDKDGWTVITHAHVLWEGEIYSTPLDQLEILNECR